MTARRLWPPPATRTCRRRGPARYCADGRRPVSSGDRSRRWWFAAISPRAGGTTRPLRVRRVGRMQQRPRQPEALLLAEGEHAIPVRFFLKARGQLRQAHLGERHRDPIRAKASRLAGKDDRGLQRSDGEIGTLRQHHQRCVCRNRDRAGSERPDAGDGTKQRRLAGAGRARDERPLACAKADAARRDQRCPVGQAHEKLLQADLACRGLSDADRAGIGSQGGGACDRFLEPVEAGHVAFPDQARGLRGREGRGHHGRRGRQRSVRP